MPQTPTHPMTRRSFLKLLALGSAVTAGGYALYEFTPWLNYEDQVESVRNFVNDESHMHALIHYATLAANGHNTQPWKFAPGQNVIDIYPDYSRELPVVDPQHRELWISLGCALENLLLAAQALGFAGTVTYPESKDMIRIHLNSDTPQPTPLFKAIPVRQNTRSEFDGKPIPSADLDQILSIPMEPGIRFRFVSPENGLETLVDYVNQGCLNQYANTAFVKELIEWLRFNRKDALATKDGLYSVCSGNPEVPAWLGRMFVAGSRPQQQADADVKKLRSSSAAIVIASETEDKTAWVRTGQVYERLALKTTAMGIKSAFLNQPVEVPDLRSQFQSAIGLDNALPQLLVRLGYADAMPQSLRRSVEQVLIEI